MNSQIEKLTNAKFPIYICPCTSDPLYKKDLKNHKNEYCSPAYAFQAQDESQYYKNKRDQKKLQALKYLECLEVLLMNPSIEQLDISDEYQSIVSISLCKETLNLKRLYFLKGSCINYYDVSSCEYYRLDYSHPVFPLASTCLHLHKVFFIGGLSPEKISNKVITYNTRKNTFSHFTDLPFPVYLSACTVFQNSLLIFSGKSDANHFTDSIIRINLHNKTFTILPLKLPEKPILPSVTVFNFKIYLAVEASSIRILNEKLISTGTIECQMCFGDLISISSSENHLLAIQSTCIVTYDKAHNPISSTNLTSPPIYILQSPIISKTSLFYLDDIQKTHIEILISSPTDQSDPQKILTSP